jgi:alpha-mannosidase
VYARSNEGGETTTTVDIPACGFVVLRGGDRTTRQGRSIGKIIREKLRSGPKPIVEHDRLRNEFMEVAISSESGGISGVYSGATRGNRFSLRLIHNAARGPAGDQGIIMRCSSLRVVASTAAMGCIETEGEILGGKVESTLATFALRYTLLRGSRTIRVDGELSAQITLGDKPWDNYFATRVAVETESAIYRSLLRDKVHRVRSRRLVSPLGVVIDEAERQTLVAAGGLAFHRRVGERFLDTLLPAEAESTCQFTLFFGFDVRHPVAVARSLIAPPVHVPIQAARNVADIGWIVHAAPKDILVSRLTVDRRGDGKLAAIVRVIQTRPQSCKASIRFLRDVECALQLQRLDDDPLNQPLPRDEAASSDVDGEASPTAADRASDQAQPTKLHSKGDLVSLPIPSHGVVDLLVVFVEHAGTA